MDILNIIYNCWGLLTSTILTRGFGGCSIWFAPLCPFHATLAGFLRRSHRVWGKGFCCPCVGTQGGSHSFSSHYIQKGCSAHPLTMAGKSCFYLENVTIATWCEHVCDYIESQYNKIQYQFTFFFWASMALRFSSSFILS